MKKCKICQEEKDINDFYKSHLSKDGHRGTCKKCYVKKSNDIRKVKRTETVSDLDNKIKLIISKDETIIILKQRISELEQENIKIKENAKKIGMIAFEISKKNIELEERVKALEDRQT